MYPATGCVRRRCHCRGVILLIRAEALQLAPERSAEAVLLRRQRGFPSLQPLPHRGAGRHTRWPPHRTVILESLHCPRDMKDGLAFISSNAAAAANARLHVCQARHAGRGRREA
ncbi:unnamed protein product [Gadus morhua 'NCC']